MRPSGRSDRSDSPARLKPRAGKTRRRVLVVDDDRDRRVRREAVRDRRPDHRRRAYAAGLNDSEGHEDMFTPRAIGFVRTPYTDTKSIPKGLGARHDAGGVVEVLSELEAGLTDIDG